MTREDFNNKMVDFLKNPSERKVNELFEQVTVPCWISVEDELPTKYDSYLTLSRGNVIEITHYNIDGWHTESKGKVTHWMPLPAPPKKGDSDI